MRNFQNDQDCSGSKIRIILEILFLMGCLYNVVVFIICTYPTRITLISLRELDLSFMPLELMF